MKNAGKRGLLTISGFLVLSWIYLGSIRPDVFRIAELAVDTPAESFVHGRNFRQWMSDDHRDLSQGITWAEKRGRYMRNLIRNDPRQAIAEALTLSEWSKLPPEVRRHVERPFSAVADVKVMIACGPDYVRTMISTHVGGQTPMQTHVYGRRAEMASKNSIPIQGIHIDGVAALRPETFQEIAGDDLAAALDRFPVAVADPGEGSAAGLAGGSIFFFKSRHALDEANERICSLEALPGPNSGGQLFKHLTAASLDGGIDYEALESAARAASDAWSGTPRDMYVIMVDFPDVPGPPADPAAFSNTLNTVVSQQIGEMSYGKTHIVATVNPVLYHLASPSSDFSTNAEPLHDEAVALVEGDGVDLSPYETVCVIFPHAASLPFAGLADIGERRMWLNGGTGEYLVTHELGHNYGASHASSWVVSGNDPVDPAGSRIEYGDFLDIMGAGPVPQGHFNAWHKKNIGWFGPANWLTVTTSGTYRVYRSDHYETSGVLRGLEIGKGTADQYWAGLRQEFPEYDTFSRGAYLLWKQDGTGRSHLLDTTPQSPGGAQDGGLALGQTYSDPTAEVHITPVARGGTTPDEWMDITVNLGSFPGNSAPAAALAGPTSLSARTSAFYEISASDPDGDELAYHWDIGDGLVKPNRPSISAAWLVGGTATVSCVVSDMKGGTNRVSAAVTLSDPLENWTQRASGTSTHLKDICLGNGRLVAVGDQGTTVYSDDGTNWVVHASGSVSMGNVYFDGIVHDGTQFISAGRDKPSLDQMVVFTSTDGTFWIKRLALTPGVISGAVRFNDVAFGGGHYVAVGYKGYTAHSVDGINWTPVISGTSTDLYGVSYGNGTFVAVGAGIGGGPAVALVSTDGLSWTNTSAGVNLESWRGLYDVQYCADRFLAGGWHARILYSTDQGQTFAAPMTGNGLIIPAFAHGNGTFFAAGIEKVDEGAWVNYDINLVSLDGVTWERLATPNQEDRSAAVFYNNTFITVGDNGTIMQSDPVEILSSGYGVWQLSNAAALGFDRDPGDDADADGYRNLYEYAVGSSATDAGSLPPGGTAGESGGFFTATFLRGRMAPDIDYGVSRASSLMAEDWDTADAVIIDNTETTLTAQSVFPMASQTNEYMRLNIDFTE